MKKCFIIMPIGKAGTDDYNFYLKVYEMMIEPVVTSLGYEVKRADKIDSLGNINRDIIELLSTAELVIADLSKSNPNVFYELGVRHALFECGTIPIIREGENLPFDVSGYRALFYKVELDGPDKFKSELKNRILSYERMTEKRSDNPVHDILSPHKVDHTPAHLQELEDMRKQEKVIQSLLIRLTDIEGEIEQFRKLTSSSSQISGTEFPYLVGDIVKQWRHFKKDIGFINTPAKGQKDAVWRVLEITDNYVHLELIEGKYFWDSDKSEQLKPIGYNTKFFSSDNYRSKYPGCKGNEQILKEWRKV